MSSSTSPGSANSMATGPQQYAQLGNYNGGGCSRGIQAPVPMSSVTGYYIVPAYSSIGYQALTSQGRGNDPCNSGGNYFTIANAYGMGADSCQQQYMGSLC